MKVCVFGLWHLGCVTAACLAKGGHAVIGLEQDADLIKNLNCGRAPLFEPGLDELLSDSLRAGRLRFTTDVAEALSEADVVWVCFDTPVSEDDVADIEAVLGPVRRLFGYLQDGTLVLVSSQLPVGSTRALAVDYRLKGQPARVTFGYSPENLRLGKALDMFLHPDRVVVGLEIDDDFGKVRALLAPFTDNVLWMSIESAEMTKHAINAFLATSVVFANEIAEICEKVGADAKEVERGLKSEQRIGPKAYLSPGGAVAGGTLARDVNFLSTLSRGVGLSIELIPAVGLSNDWHRSWSLRTIEGELGTIAGRRVALLGLTYKPGTSTLRRSSAVELGLALAERGAHVVAFDPKVDELPAELRGKLALAASPEAALTGASAAIIGTEWPALREMGWSTAIARMARPLILDPNWFLAGIFKDRADVDYAAVGLSRSVNTICGRKP
jgi:UDPglucose 6-dehydrogenase